MSDLQKTLYRLGDEIERIERQCSGDVSVSVHGDTAHVTIEYDLGEGDDE